LTYSTAKSVVLGLAVLLSSVVPAAAQGEFGISYSFLRQWEEPAPAGVTIDYTHPVTTIGTSAALGAVGEFSMNRLSDIDITQTTFLGGVRVTAAGGGRIQPFGQFLLGVLHWPDINDFAIQPGGGVKIGMNPAFDLRVQVDFPIDFFEGETETGFRLNVGVVFPVGP